MSAFVSCRGSFIGQSLPRESALPKHGDITRTKRAHHVPDLLVLNLMQEQLALIDDTTTGCQHEELCRVTNSGCNAQRYIPPGSTRSRLS